MCQNGGFRPLSENVLLNLIQTWGIHLLGECSEMIRFWATLAQFWPSSGQKKWKWIEMVISDHYLKKYSHNPTQTWCVHLLGECSKLVRFWAALTKFWSSSAHKMTANGGFQSISENVFTQSNSNLVCALIGWVLIIDLLLGQVC